MSKKSFKIFNEVLLTRDGWMFLIGGNHRILEYITGKLKPKSESFENFRNNLLRRKKFCEKHGIEYIHIVVPEKQSALEDKFPIKPIIRLADLYKDYGEFMYPLKQLSNPNLWFKTDTHLNGFGSIVMASLIAEYFLKINDIEYHMNKLTQQIQMRYRLGDLGQKIKPPIKEKEYIFFPTYNYFYFGNRLPAGNDGIIDIYINFNAVSNKRILIFGDSFARFAARPLSYYFSEILFVRSRYFHKEIVLGFNPNFLITQNVERYLSHVFSDEEAPNALLMPLLKSRIPKYDYNSLEALNAILAYGTKTYFQFVRKIKSGNLNSKECTTNFAEVIYNDNLPKINYFSGDLDFFKIDTLNANLLNGRLTIGGLALPKANAEDLKLTIKDVEGIKEIQWGLPSPVFGEQHKDNPKAKNARFRVDNVAVGDKPIEVFVNDKKVAEIKIEGK